MKLNELRKIIQEEILNALNEIATPEQDSIEEKSVPQPYNRYSARKMTKSQIAKREKLGKAMLANKSTVKQYREKYGEDWESWIWATASGRVLKNKGD